VASTNPHRVPSPSRLLADVVAELQAGADPKRAAGAKVYFKKFEPVHLYGVATPEVRAIARRCFAMVRGRWTVSEAIRFAELAVARREMETKVVGFVLLGRFAADFPPSLAATLRRWAERGHCANWAITDALSSEVARPLLRRHPRLVRTVTAWHRSPVLWVRRLALVPLVSLAHHGEHLDAVYGVAQALLADSEDLIHKACGWLLREAGTTDMPRLERFLLRHGPRIHRTTLRYAIERMAPGRRRHMLAATRRPRSRA
jgi:3-methyladenine DNA glycosylase AlkD